MGGSILSKKWSHNRPHEFKYEPKLQPYPTIPNFMEDPKEYDEA